jgi:solute carrier family 35 (UDP-galactose transporter), member B1
MYLQILGGSGLNLPIQAISVSGATQMLAMASSNEALKYVSYPTQVSLPLLSPLSIMSIS